MSIEIKLSKPVSAHGAEITSITLREPMGGDVIDCGFPMTMIASEGNDTEMRIDARIIGKYISKLGDVPLSTVKNLSMADIQAAQGIIMGFFGDTQES